VWESGCETVGRCLRLSGFTEPTRFRRTTRARKAGGVDAKSRPMLRRYSFGPSYACSDGNGSLY